MAHTYSSIDDDCCSPSHSTALHSLHALHTVPLAWWLQCSARSPSSQSFAPCKKPYRPMWILRTMPDMWELERKREREREQKRDDEESKPSREEKCVFWMFEMDWVPCGSESWWRPARSGTPRAQSSRCVASSLLCSRHSWAKSLSCRSQSVWNTCSQTRGSSTAPTTD